MNRSTLTAILLASLASFTVAAQTEETKPADPYFQQFHPLKAPAPEKHFLKPGDRLAICGDSITEQKKYSRIMETYLTVCVPELNISVRQYGWSGETAPQFLARMTNDCLRFNPTVETTCYGMNDHGYRAYTDSIGEKYRSSSTAIVEAFKAHDVRAIQGSPGCVGKKPAWLNPDPTSTVDQLNQNLCELRNIGLGIAKDEKVGFADVFWPMLGREPRNAGKIRHQLRRGRQGRRAPGLGRPRDHGLRVPACLRPGWRYRHFHRGLEIGQGEGVIQATNCWDSRMAN